ncbi:hypothetical protein YC2023_010223 [Brassica napus]
MMLRNVSACAVKLVISDDEVAKRVVRTVTKSPSFAKSVSYSSSSLLCLYKGKCLSRDDNLEFRCGVLRTWRQASVDGAFEDVMAVKRKKPGAEIRSLLPRSSRDCYCPRPSLKTDERGDWNES